MIGIFIDQLKRRNVSRAALLHIGAVWALAQGIAQLGPELGAPEFATRWLVIAAVISDGLSEGFIVALSRIKNPRVIYRKSSF